MNAKKEFKKQLNTINSLVTEYVTNKIVTKRSTDIHLKVKALCVLLIHNGETKKISEKILNLKGDSNSMSIFGILDKYVEYLLKDFDELSYEQLQGVKVADVVTEPVSISDYFKNTWTLVKTINTSSEYNEIKYPIIYDNQTAILKEYNKLAQDLNINSSLNLCNFFTFLLWSGYFSPTKSHSYQLRDRILGNPTFEVFQGKGVCLNYSALLKEFLLVCGKEANQVGCMLDSKHTEIDMRYKNLIERKTDISGKEQLIEDIVFLIADPLVKLIGNHAITLVEGEEHAFYYDPTNLYVLNPYGNTEARVINGTGTFGIKSDYSINAHSNLYFEKLRDSFTNIALSGVKGGSFTNDEIFESMSNTFNLLRDNEKTLNTVYEGIRPRILTINNEIDKHKIELK